MGRGDAFSIRIYYEPIISKTIPLNHAAFATFVPFHFILISDSTWKVKGLEILSFHHWKIWCILILYLPGSFSWHLSLLSLAFLMSGCFLNTHLSVTGFIDRETFIPVLYPTTPVTFHIGISWQFSEISFLIGLLTCLVFPNPFKVMFYESRNFEGFISVFPRERESSRKSITWNKWMNESSVLSILLNFLDWTFQWFHFITECFEKILTQLLVVQSGNTDSKWKGNWVNRPEGQLLGAQVFFIPSIIMYTPCTV